MYWGLGYDPFGVGAPAFASFGAGPVLPGQATAGVQGETGGWWDGVKGFLSDMGEGALNYLGVGIARELAGLFGGGQEGAAGSGSGSAGGLPVSSSSAAAGGGGLMMLGLLAWAFLR